MKELVRKDILDVIKKSIIAIENNNLDELRALSDQTIKDSTTAQDKYSISMAVIIYSLYKIFSKGTDGKFKDKSIDLLKKSYNNLQKGNIPSYYEIIKKIYHELSIIEKKFGLYITEVINQAKIKKSSKVYEQGLTAGKAASLLGISPWELMNYIGNTKIADEPIIETKSVIERLNIARDVLK